MAEGWSHREPQTVDLLSSSHQETARNHPVSNFAMLGRRPMSDSSIKYEENAFNDSPEVKLVHFAERRSSFSTQGTNSDGDGDNSSDDGLKGSITRTKAPEQPFRFRCRKGPKTAFDCDCSQSQKAKRKTAKKLSTLSTSSGLSCPVVADGNETKSHTRKKEGKFMKRVKKLFWDSGSPTNSDEPPFSDGFGSSNSKSIKTATEGERSTKKDIQKKDRHYIIGDILAVTNCSYYWGSINRHEAEEVSIRNTIRCGNFKFGLFTVVFTCIEFIAFCFCCGCTLA